MSKIISVIVPCYNEEASLEAMHTKLGKIAVQIENDYGVDFEFLFIDDGSSDKTLAILTELAVADSRVHYISLSRNFGKESAVYAGIDNAAGDYIAVIDADLQHPPTLLRAMYAGIVDQGYDCVCARRLTRTGEPLLRSAFSKLFYVIMDKLSSTELVEGATDFCMMTRAKAMAIREMKEFNRFYKGIFSWVGFNTLWIPYENVKREAGQTKWSFKALLKYSLDAIMSFSTAPLAIASHIGILLCVISFFLICAVVVKTAIYGDPVAGFPTLICTICFIGGIQLFCLGIIGEYLARMYLEIKKRPIYIAKIVHLSSDTKPLDSEK